MSDSNHSHTGRGIKVRRPPWLLFLFLTTVFFLSYHDPSDAKKGFLDAISADDFSTKVANGSLVRQIVLSALGIVAIISLVRDRTQSRLRIDGLLGWLLIGSVAWAFTSLIWAADPLLTLRRLAIFGIFCIAALAIARRLSLREVILWTFLSSALFLAIGILAEAFFGSFQPFASGYRFAGTLHPNGQGIQCGLLLLSAMAAADIEKRWRALFWTSGSLGFAFLILTGSRTALAATLIALLVYLAAVRSRGSKIAMVVCLGIVLCVLPFFSETGLIPGLENAILHRSGDLGPVGSFNGRADLWKDLGYDIRQHPILGYGYGGFWTPVHVTVISDEEKWGVPNGHSAYIDSLLNLGTVGLVAYTLLFFAGIWRFFRLYIESHDSIFAFCGALLVFCALDGLFESALVEGSLLTFLWMVVLAQVGFCVSLGGPLAAHRRKESAERKMQVSIDHPSF